ASRTPPAVPPSGAMPSTTSRATPPAQVATTTHGKAASTDPTGAIARCKDGVYWHSAHHQGACSRHGGVGPGMDGGKEGGILCDVPAGAISGPDVVQHHREARARLRELLLDHGDGRVGVRPPEPHVELAPVLCDVALVAAVHVAGFDRQRRRELPVD